MPLQQHFNSIPVFKYFFVPLGLIFVVFRLYSIKLRNKCKTKLKNKVVMITGASSGLGEALAHTFYSQGCSLILAARRVEQLQRVKNDLLELKQNAGIPEPIALQIDLADIETLEKKMVEFFKDHPLIDILINNGGISCRGNVLETNIDVHKKIMNVNHFGPLALTKVILPQMVERKSGHIIFVSSLQGRIAIPDRSAYAASKHACQAVADSLRAEVSKYNVQVSVISPGYIQTALSVNALTGSGDNYGAMDQTTASGYKPEYVAERILDMVLHQHKELILAPFAHRIAVLLRYLVPSLYFRIMDRRAK